jgi:hypothetical protein
MLGIPSDYCGLTYKLRVRIIVNYYYSKQKGVYHYELLIFQYSLYRLTMNS